MNALRNSLHMWKLAGAGRGLRNRLIAFLCARLGSLAERRKTLRKLALLLIGCFARNGQVVVQFRISGQPLVVSLRHGNQADYLVFGEMVMQSYKLPPNLLRRPATVVDGGANIGLFALCSHAMFPGIKVTCYEPDRDNLAQLRRNLKANNIQAEVIPKALWSETADLYFHPGQSYSGFVNAEPSPYPISCVTPVVPDHSWLKLDIEGAEYEVLSALLEAGLRPGITSMEIHEFDRWGGRLLSELKRHGYDWNETFPAAAQCVNICAFARSQ